jgi:hypothetical protein
MIFDLSFASKEKYLCLIRLRHFFSFVSSCNCEIHTSTLESALFCLPLVMSVLIVMIFNCTCRQGGHPTLLPTTWHQFLTQEQLLQLHGTELQRFQWRTSCMIQKASSSTGYASFTDQNTILTAKSSGGFSHSLWFDFRLCFAWAEKSSSVLFCLHIIQRAVRRICGLTSVKWRCTFGLLMSNDICLCGVFSGVRTRLLFILPEWPEPHNDDDMIASS